MKHNVISGFSYSSTNKNEIQKSSEIIAYFENLVKQRKHSFNVLFFFYGTAMEECSVSGTGARTSFHIFHSTNQMWESCWIELCSGQKILLNL